MESSTRYKLLLNVEETRDFLKDLEKKLDQDDNDSMSEIYKFKKALEWVEEKMIPYYPLGVYKDRSADSNK